MFPDELPKLLATRVVDAVRAAALGIFQPVRQRSVEEHQSAISLLQKAAQRFNHLDRQVALAPAADLASHLRRQRPGCSHHQAQKGFGLIAVFLWIWKVAVEVLLEDTVELIGQGLWLGYIQQLVFFDQP